MSFFPKKTGVQDEYSSAMQVFSFKSFRNIFFLFLCGLFFCLVNASSIMKYQVASVLINNRKYGKAIDYFEKASILNPKDERIYKRWFAAWTHVVYPFLLSICPRCRLHQRRDLRAPHPALIYSCRAI